MALHALSDDLLMRLSRVIGLSLTHTRTHPHTHAHTHAHTVSQHSPERACLSIFIYGETNRQFRASGNIVYGETGKIREIALSRYPRQVNCNVNKTKSYYWISSKLTPVDAS